MQVTISVGGMSCAHCADRVKKAIEEVKGVKRAEIDIDSGKATVEIEDPGAIQLVREAIRAAGYQVQ